MDNNLIKIRKAASQVILPIQHFISGLELSGLILIGTTVVALMLANSSYGEPFLHFWHTELRFGFGSWEMDMDLHTLINDVLMTFFFIVVGGEIKREIIEGALSSRDKAILPIIAALGGMLFPAIIYSVFNFNSDTSSGWGIPTATDIAFSLTVISLLGKKVPFSLKIFLAALAIADDLGAIVVIALFYSSNVNLMYLVYALLIISIMYGMNKSNVMKIWPYTVTGILLWFCFYDSGIHPTIAGVVYAIMVPFSIPNYETVFNKHFAKVLQNIDMLKASNNSDKLVRAELIEEMQQVSTKMESPLHNVIVFLQPMSAYFIMPLFALSNAGVVMDTHAFSQLSSPVSLGIVFGLMLGKSAGIWITCYAAVKYKIARLPDDINWKYLYGMAWLAGIGFTMSIFVTQLAFDNKGIIATAKVSIILASLGSALVGFVFLSLLSKINKKKINTLGI